MILALKPEEITFDHDIEYAEDGMEFYIRTIFDVCKKFGIEAGKYPDDDLSVDFYALYHPVRDTIKCYYIIKYSDEKGINQNINVDYCPTQPEIIAIKAGIEQYCLLINGNDLKAEWNTWIAKDDNPICSAAAIEGVGIS